jgi:glyoxylase-like metal-dependent hydrolase (beta-lactamase superfamily II)
MPTARIRMYRQGLGDCFLLTFPKGRGESHVLIDCGVLKGTPEAQERLRTIAEDIVKTTKKKLDVLVVTHEHWDHVSGFIQAQTELAQLQVGQVWVAWTENPKDDLANELRTRRKKALNAVKESAKRLAAAGDSGAQRNAFRIDGLLDFFGGLGATGRATTTAAFDWAKSRAGTRIKYLRPGEIVQIPGLPNMRAYVLGPPHDRVQLKRSDPSRVRPEVYELGGDGGDESGFLAAVDTAVDSADQQHPFEKFFRISGELAKKDPLLSARYAPGVEEWRQVEHDWLGLAGRLALKLDSDTNNTSLALAFELAPSNRVLLFPGDAQVGNWMSWESLTWTEQRRGRAKSTTMENLFERTVLYKVGHHGSHNATMRTQGLELMKSEELVAMVPVDRRTAKKLKWNMPFPSLWARLEARTKGRIIDLEYGVQAPSTGPTAEWQRFKSKTTETPDWIEYEVTM